MQQVLVIIVTLCIFGCSSHSQNKKIIYDCTIKDTISQEDKFLNVDKYKDELYKNGGITLFENDTILIDVSLNSNSMTKRIKNKKTNIVKAIEYNDITKKITSYLFYYMKDGYPDLGKEYHYDQSGNITKVIDHDDRGHYPLCYKEAEAIVMKKVGKKFEITSISRESKIINNKTMYYWEVVASKIGSYRFSDKKQFWIDAKTGKIIKVAKMRLSTDDYLGD